MRTSSEILEERAALSSGHIPNSRETGSWGPETVHGPWAAKFTDGPQFHILFHIPQLLGDRLLSLLKAGSQKRQFFSACISVF